MTFNETKNNHNGPVRPKKIWIDLENTPHVPFFKPIIEELERRGCSVLVTARDCFQVCELADLSHVCYKRIGRHYGKHTGAKLAGLGVRTLQMMPTIIREKPDLAVSHGSRSLFLVSSLLRIPNITMFDYEHVKWAGFTRLSKVMVPDIISDQVASVIGIKKERVFRYPGLKEDVYAPSFRPDPSIRERLYLRPDEIVVTVRPPATEAHYHNPESEILLNSVLDFLGHRPNTKTIVLPRTAKQEGELREKWPDLFSSGKVVVPDHVVDGMNLIWFSDLVISGGGTMNREAAALGVPVYSIFRGKLGAVDKYLAEAGRLTLLRSPEDVCSRIALVHRHVDVKRKTEVGPTLQSIVENIVGVMESEYPSATPPVTTHFRQEKGMHDILNQYYRCPDNSFDLRSTGVSCGRPGFFSFGQDVVCYGNAPRTSGAAHPFDALYDAGCDISLQNGSVHLPFDPGEVVENLRRERYVPALYPNGTRSAFLRACRGLYYRLRPVIPVGTRPYLKKAYLNDWEKTPFPRWPVDTTVDLLLEHLVELSLATRRITQVPFIWFWPAGYESCTIMTHDVETRAGYDFVGALMDMDESAGIKASFQIIPEERYTATKTFLRGIQARGFEVNVHDLNHDGRLFDDRHEFQKKVRKINEYGRRYGAAGYRTGVMYRNQDWYDTLEFEYDMSVPNAAHLDVQHGGCCTVMPYFIGNILELPLTTAQDYFLFYFLKDYSIDLWKRQIEMIKRQHGMISFIVHPDYVIADRNRATFKALLEYLAGLRRSKTVWFALPGEVNRWWRQRSKMWLVRHGSDWMIEGEGSERARIAYAYLRDGKVAYRISEPHAAYSTAEEDSNGQGGDTFEVRA